MPQIGTICKIVKGESKFNHIERNKDVRPAKSCKECNSKKCEEKRRDLESTYQHLRIKKDDSNTTDRW